MRQKKFSDFFGARVCVHFCRATRGKPLNDCFARAPVRMVTFALAFAVALLLPFAALATCPGAAALLGGRRESGLLTCRLRVARGGRACVRGASCSPSGSARLSLFALGLISGLPSPSRVLLAFSICHAVWGDGGWIASQGGAASRGLRIECLSEDERSDLNL